MKKTPKWHFLIARELAVNTRFAFIALGIGIISYCTFYYLLNPGDNAISSEYAKGFSFVYGQSKESINDSVRNKFLQDIWGKAIDVLVYTALMLISLRYITIVYKWVKVTTAT